MYIINSRKNFCSFWKMRAKNGFMWTNLTLAYLFLSFWQQFVCECKWRPVMVIVLVSSRGFLINAFQKESPGGPNEQLMRGKITFSQVRAHCVDLLGGSMLYWVSTLAFNSPWARSCFLKSPPPWPPITYQTARHWTECFWPHCSLPGPTWGMFQALRNCDRKLGNKSSYFKTEPLNH